MNGHEIKFLMFLFVLSNFAAFALRTLRAFVIVLFLLVLRIDSIPNRTGPNISDAEVMEFKPLQFRSGPGL